MKDHTPKWPHLHFAPYWPHFAPYWGCPGHLLGPFFVAPMVVLVEKKQSIFQLWKIPFTFLTTGILGFSHRVPILVTVLPLQMAKSSVVWNPVIYVLMNKQVFSKDIFWICVKWID